MKKIPVWLLAAALLLLLTACNDRKKSDAPTAGGMKCTGGGKCTGSLAGRNTSLAKKQQIILSQMRDDDPRRTCVMTAKSVQALYDCVRDPATGRLSAKCGEAKAPAPMKCGAGKCGGK